MFDLIIRGKGKELKKTFKSSTVTLGRRLGNDVALDDLSVSKNHAQIEERRKGYLLVDLQSSNGTFVNEQKVDKALLKHGDVIRLGDAELVFLARSPGDLAEGMESAAEAMDKGVGYETMLARISLDQKDLDVAAMKKDYASGQETGALVDHFVEMGWSLSEAKALAEEAKGKPAEEIDESIVIDVAIPKPSELILKTSKPLLDVDRGRLVRFRGEEALVVACSREGGAWEYRLKRG